MGVNHIFSLLSSMPSIYLALFTKGGENEIFDSKLTEVESTHSNYFTFLIFWLILPVSLSITFTAFKVNSSFQENLFKPHPKN